MKIKKLYLVALIIVSASFNIKSQGFQLDRDTSIHKAPPFVPIPTLKTRTNSSNYIVNSPNNVIKMTIAVENNQISYSVDKNDESLIKQSALNINLASGALNQNITSNEATYTYKDEIKNLLYGERNTVDCLYNEMSIPCINGQGIKFNILARAYNNGFAFCFNFQKHNNTSSINISNESLQFAFATNYTVYAESRNEQGYTSKSIQNTSRTLIPLTLTNNTNSICINEACNDGFPRVYLRSSGTNTLQTNFISSSRSFKLPYKTPWRYGIIGDSPNDLIEKKEMLYSFDDHDIIQEDWTWLKPGKVFRCYQLTTQDAKNAIDFCQEMNIKYMLFDAGWYGLGYGQGNEKNPASNPFDVISAIDMPAVLSYANDHGIGLILYINKVAWYNYDNNAMFDLYESWGIKGLKLGFVDGYSATGTKKVYDIIKEAANRKMFINVHDEFRPSGMVYKYPNLFTSEGIRGNENRFNTGDHTCLLPYTRFLTGAADYTICYKGQDPNYKFPSVFNTKKAHQLALSIMFYSPLQHVFWYAKPSIYTKPVEIEVFKKIPTVWDDFKLAKGEIGNHYSIARKKGPKWYLATICNNTSSSITVPLDFLDVNIDYNVLIYTDGDSDNIIKRSLTLSELMKQGELTKDGLVMSLRASGGQVCIFTPRDANYIWDQTLKSSKLKLIPNPAKNNISLRLEHLDFAEAKVKIISYDGSIVLEKITNFTSGKISLNINYLKTGIYIVTVESNDQCFAQKLVVQ